MSSDCYAILGVTPAAEDVVIRAAYRALIRHYHPDTNPDPDAQARARAITAAYSVLRDPATRAEYDARLANGNLWLTGDEDAPERRPPAMRGVGITAALLSVALVAAVWPWAQVAEPPGRTDVAIEQAAPKLAAAPPEPVVALEPESERLAKLRREAEALARTPRSTVGEALTPEPPPPAAKPVTIANIAPARPAVPPQKRATTAGARAPAAPAVAPNPAVSDPKTTKADPTDRLATLDRMAGGFFAQSMVHADAARKASLISSRDRLTAEREACRSDSCVTNAYLRQMREISAIMEGQAAPAK